MMRRRRPLMRAAMVGGGAYVAGKHAQRSNQREADQEARIEDLEAQQQPGYSEPPPPPPAYAPPPPPEPAPPPPAAGGGDDLVSKLQQLQSLKDQGVLTDEEFSAAKSKLLTS